MHINVDRGVTGWTGSDCSTPICVQGFYDPTCKDPDAIGGEGCFRCANGGICVAPDTCDCSDGWTGFYCQTPTCRAKITPLIREQLGTVDKQKLHNFENDPCGMKGVNGPEIINGVGK